MVSADFNIKGLRPELMVLFIGSKWFCLQDKFLYVFTIVIGPAMNFRNFSRPVAMTRANRRGPFQCICLPGVFRNYFSSFKYGIKKVEYKHQLHSEYHHRNRRYKSVQTSELVE